MKSVKIYKNILMLRKKRPTEMTNIPHTYSKASDSRICDFVENNIQILITHTLEHNFFNYPNLIHRNADAISFLT